MAILVCCPCGNPLDCEELDIVITLTCPRCHREIEIEVEAEGAKRLRAVLTVMEGPHWVGEQFVIPTEANLTIGHHSNNWLSLESDKISDKHCQLRLSSDGNLELEDLKSASGTWIGPSRILKGKLKEQESFTVGEFRFRFDLRSALGSSEIVNRAAPKANAQYLPDLDSVLAEGTLGSWLARHRFHVARHLILAFAWMTFAYHACRLMVVPNPPWHWYSAFAVGFAPFALLVVSGRRVTLVHRYLKFVVIGVLVAIGIADAAWMQQPLPAAAAIAMAGTLPLLVARVPSSRRALAAMLPGCLSALTMLILAVRHVMMWIERFTSHL